jgi:hypothetical protein
VNEVKFNDIYSSDIGSYNYSDRIFSLYCNKSETFFDITDTNLISLSNDLVNPEDNPVQKARKIYDWITENILYEVQNEEKGASWAYSNRKGDCSEYADLMITLLRIQNIPARKVLGFVVTPEVQKIPKIGDYFTYDLTYDGSSTNKTSNLTQHAWLEYFVPNIGWIACDPTWGVSGLNYFNYMDYFHIASNIGAWFNYSSVSISEYPIYPYVYRIDYHSYDYSYQIRITVIDINLKTIDWILISIFISLGAISLVGIAYYIINKRKKSRNISH